jgi:DNA-binding transcriptional LysR family regulator
MTLESLRILVAVADLKSFSGAAQRLFKTQPAVSQQIKALEREFGKPLIQRPQCVPTPAGRVVVERARRLLLESEALTTAMKDESGAAEAEVRVGTSDTLALYFLPKVIERFAEQMTHTKVRMVCRSTDEVIDRVLRHELDLGLVTVPAHRNELEEMKLFVDPLVLLVHKDHLLAPRDKVMLNALSGESLLLLDETTRTGKSLMEWFSRAGFTPNVSVNSGSFEVLKRYVGEGLGVAFLPASTVREKDSRTRVVRVGGAPKVSLGAVRLRGAYFTRGQRLMLQLLREHAGAYQSV